MMSHQAGRSFSKLFETIILPSGEDFITAETREYYDDFFLPDNEIKAQIIASKTLQGVEKKYTVYVIEVQLPFLKYTVEKRYNLFLDLYNKIDSEYSEIGLDKTTFPEKKIFGSFASKTIEHRKIHLNEFLHRLCEAYKTYKIIEFLEFLEVRKRLEMMKRNQVFEPMIKVTDPTKKASLDDQQAFAYVNLLFKKPKVLSNTFKEFEKFFIEKRPKLSKRAVEVLFHGDKSMPGLIHICGKYDERTDSHLTCGNGLNFILKLLDHEHNQDAGFYNQVFASTSYKDIMNLYFEQHIQGKGFKPCKVAALKLLYIFMNHNMNISISVILSSEETIQEYETWRLSQQTTSIKAENFTKI